MKQRQMMIGLLACTLLLLPAAAWAKNTELAASSFAEGNELLDQGHFNEALRAFAAAAKADSDNQEYREQYGVLRRVIKIRKSLDTERNPEKWETSALALRAFYYDHKLYSEAVVLDRQAHERFNSADSAALLADTLLNLGNNSEAIEVLQAVPSDKATLQTRVLTGIALARDGRMDEARGLASQCKTIEDTSPGMLFDVARLQALVGEDDAALGLLTQCFEATPPSRLAAFKDYAKGHGDLSTLSSTDGFATALETQSKVKESGCSGGSSCGSCPCRGKGCGSSTGKSCADEKK